MKESLPAHLERRMAEAPDKPSFTFLADGEDERIDFTRAEIMAAARNTANDLGQRVSPGERVLLLYPSGPEFISAFLGCLMAGVIAVPAHPPRLRGRIREHDRERLEGIIADAEPSLLLAPRVFAEALRGENERGELGELGVFVTDEDTRSGGHANTKSPAGYDASADTPAFIQYTSGSTGVPRGVVVTHGNLMANQEMIHSIFGVPGEMVVAGWLPPHHDMGLIGQILQPLYNGGYCVFMAPMYFLQKPLRWLRAITRFRANTSPAPNFAYEHCLESIDDADLAKLDLSTWVRALNGAEPVRHDVLHRFAERFASVGFSSSAFYPCYGLAEATLVVSGRKLSPAPVLFRARSENLNPGNQVKGEVPEMNTQSETSAPPAGYTDLVGCGGVHESLDIRIVEPETDVVLPEGSVGEILLRGPCVAAGYWKNREPETFQARTSQGEGPYLRTGDLGFLRRGELFITGRIKDLIIVDGRNLYPRDIETGLAARFPEIRVGGIAAFGAEVNRREEIIVTMEIERSHRSLDQNAFIAEAREFIGDWFGASPGELVLLRPGALPRTSSGKPRRSRTRELYLAGELARLTDGDASQEKTRPAVGGKT